MDWFSARLIRHADFAMSCFRWSHYTLPQR
jgi:hypothetical protein